MARTASDRNYSYPDRKFLEIFPDHGGDGIKKIHAL